ncbi:hypothetical protein BDY19DRAFT_995998 [Irpex rosettiformis]|uniref:Uncharacterized protein n=1 Tax=Irpex rosettiformis TaxID=378272 RepID=A0ACB8TWG6_9APHY|nr:hypothetical protein BDY19DRAFT_995998 [Irpex rosettiformis]
MRFSTVAAALLPVAGVYAADIVVKVGDGGLTFTPNTVTANSGDNLIFSFVAKNHTVTQSTFAAPCTENGPIDSGFMNIPAGSGPANYTVPVNDSTTPVWFYCKQVLNGVSHCSQGMVFALNPTADKTFGTFQATANATASSTNSSSSASPSGASSASGSSPSSTSHSSSSNAPAPTSSTTSGAMKIGSSAAIALSAVGLAAGMLL